ncbi:hypothetical protein BIW11_04471 [Tropilaelaps mercedesae]|uniref:Uncharacterized protein n=1 Tax=Tropilaelaps mercedesae TaxID=418985 RepID=A0A1V9X699_9ACAR|nr:hypothetical protein BIW11_04471 [Tropilaelaps mercedesae]
MTPECSDNAAIAGQSWFLFLPFVDSIQSVGKGEIAKDKLYQSKTSLPVYGDITNIHRVIDYSPGQLFRLFGHSQWLRPVLTVTARQKGDKTELTVIVTFWRNSILFQEHLSLLLDCMLKTLLCEYRIPS